MSTQNASATENTGPLLMATTTSTDNTGLLDVLIPVFQEKTGIDLRWLAVGTGKALKLGRNCDVDVLLVHAPEAEKQFMASGYGQQRRQVMHNDFVLVGPREDPAGIHGLSPDIALEKIRDQGALFLSRGDNSGTNKKELTLWRRALGTHPETAPWYQQTGQGMLTTLTMAAEKQGYTLTDRGTWIKFATQRGAANPLTVLVQGDPSLFNQYSVITINPARCPDTRAEQAGRFADWLLSPQAQTLIKEFRLMGQPLFIPDGRLD